MLIAVIILGILLALTIPAVIYLIVWIKDIDSSYMPHKLANARFELIDNMFHRLDDYAKEADTILAEAIDDLREEIKKND